MASKITGIQNNLSYASPEQIGDTTSDTEPTSPAPKRRKLQSYPTLPVECEFTAGSFGRVKKFFDPEKRTIWCTKKYCPIEIPENATLEEARELLYNLISAIGFVLYFAYFDILPRSIGRYVKLETLEM